MAAINEKLRLYDETFDDKSHTDVNRLANALLTQADILSPIVTRLYGDMSNRFPLMLYTEGMGRIRTVKSVDSLFKVPVMGKPKKYSVIGKNGYISTDVVGKGKGEFFLYFVDRWFERDYIIQSPSGIKAKIIAHPDQEGDYWKYTLKIFGSNLGLSSTCLNCLPLGLKLLFSAFSVGLFISVYIYYLYIFLYSYSIFLLIV